MVSFRTFKCSLFSKPVSWLGLFAVSYSKPALEPKAEQFVKHQFLNYKIDQNTNLPNCQTPNGDFCTYLLIVYKYQLLPLVIFELVFLMRETLRGLKDHLKYKIPTYAFDAVPLHQGLHWEDPHVL